MKSIITILVLLISNLIFAQELPNKVYEVTAESLPIKFIFKKDNRFSIQITSGVYKLKNDSIYFHNKDKTSFNVNFNKSISNSDSLQLAFENNRSFRRNDYDIYLGVKNGTNLTYKSISDYLSYNLDKDLHIGTIPKVDTLHLAFKKQRQNGYIVERYAIPQNTNQVNIKFKYLTDDDVYVRYYNAKDNYFVFNNDTVRPQQSYNYVKPLERNSNIVNLPISFDDKEEEITEDLLTNFDTSQLLIKPFQFSNLKTALKHTTPDKVLVVFNHPENDTIKNRYLNFVKTFNESTYYSDKDSLEKKRFMFYLSTSKDKSKLKKLNIKPKTITFINANNRIIRSLKKSFSSFTKEFDFQERLYDQIKFENYLSLLDDEANRPILTTKQLSTVFQKIVSKTYELPQYGYKLNSENYSTNTNSTYQDLEENNSDFSFKIKVIPEQVKAIFNNLINKHKNDKVIDQKYVQLLLDYIARDDNYKMLFNEVQDNLTDLDFEVFNYIIKFNNQIEIKAYNANDFLVSDGISDLVHFIGYSDNLLQYKTQVDNIFKAILKTKNNSPDIMDEYLNILEAHENPNILEIYNDYFNTTFNTNQSIIEQLDTFYTNSSTASSWSLFKENFADQCNRLAWAVYTENKTQYLQEAIKWSKTSLKASPNSPYYLDTLAHLYFINGQKQDAIRLQKQAIKSAEKDRNYADILEELKSELKRFQE